MAIAQKWAIEKVTRGKRHGISGVVEELMNDAFTHRFATTKAHVGDLRRSYNQDHALGEVEFLIGEYGDGALSCTEFTWRRPGHRLCLRCEGGVRSCADRPTKG